MFTKFISNMSRFFDFSLYKRTDELLRPAEKELSGRFHSTENIQLLYKRALVEVNPRTRYADVTNEMDAIFRVAIKTEQLPSVSEMNTSVMQKLYAVTQREATSQKQYADRAFDKSNVPSHFLPRPSYSNDKDDQDETIELLRR